MAEILLIGLEAFGYAFGDTATEKILRFEWNVCQINQQFGMFSGLSMIMTIECVAWNDGLVLKLYADNH